MLNLMEKLILWIFVCEVFEVEILLALCSLQTFWQLTVSNHWSNKTYGYNMFTLEKKKPSKHDFIPEELLASLWHHKYCFSLVNFDLPSMAHVNSAGVSIAQPGCRSAGLSFSTFPDRCQTAPSGLWSWSELPLFVT